MGNEKWNTGNEKWNIGNKKWNIGNEKWNIGNEKWNISSTNKTDRHDITEIVLKVPLNSINQTIKLTFCVNFFYSD